MPVRPRTTKAAWICLAVAGLAIPWVAVAHWTGHWSARIADFVGFLPLAFLLGRLASRPAPFQLVLRLADSDTGDAADEEVFERLHRCFKQDCRDNLVARFDGFDIGGGWLWFYFNGSDGAAVRKKVMALLRDCPIRTGSYFQVLGQEPELIAQGAAGNSRHAG